MSSKSEPASYLKFCHRQNLDRCFHQLEGVLKGIMLDGVLSRGEVAALAQWRAALGDAAGHEPFREVAESVDRILATGSAEKDEVDDLLWLSMRFTTPNDYYDAITADIQRLHGLSMGLLADGVLTDDEIVALSDWLDDHEYLRTVFPYDELCSLMVQILADGHIDEDERALLTAFLVDIAPEKNRNVIQYAGIDLRTMTLPAVCAVDPVIPIHEGVFCITGKCSRSPRKEMHQLIQQIGGTVRPKVTLDVQFLVIGDGGNPCWAFAKYGRKVERALKLRREGSTMLIVSEADFWDAVLDYQ